MAKKDKDGEKKAKKSKKEPEQDAEAPAKSIADLFGNGEADPALQALFTSNVRPLKTALISLGWPAKAN